MMLADDRLERLRLAVEEKYKSKIRKDDSIAEAVGEYYAIKPEEFLPKPRMKDVYWPRWLTYYLIKKHLKLTNRKIAKMVGERCFSTVHYSIQKVEAAIARDPRLAGEIAKIERKLRELQ